MLTKNWRYYRPFGPAVLGVACLLLASGCASTKDDDSVLAPLLKPLLPEKPGDLAHDVWYSYDADKRRDGIAKLSGAKFGGEDLYVRMYRVRVWDDDSTVRAACVRALGHWGTVDDVKLIVRFYEDKSGLVRWEVAQALQKIHSPNAVAPLMVMLKDDKEADVRMAAAAALAQYPLLGVFSALVGRLDDDDWGVVEAAHDALVCLTGQDCGIEGRKWNQFQQANVGKVFEHQKPYVWQPFVKPRGFWDKVQVWNSPEEIPPRVPTGMEAAVPTTGPSKS